MTSMLTLARMSSVLVIRARGRGDSARRRRGGAVTGRLVGPVLEAAEDPAQAPGRDLAGQPSRGGIPQWAVAKAQRLARPPGQRGDGGASDERVTGPGRP